MEDFPRIKSQCIDVMQITKISLYRGEIPTEEIQLMRLIYHI